MKQAVIEGERRAAVIEVPDPRPKDDWVVVRIDAAPMCTEYKGWLSGGQSRFLGHEAAGTVVEVARPSRVKVGDRVVVQPQTPCGTCALCIAGDYIHCEHTVDTAKFTGNETGWATYAQYLVKPDWLLSPIPEGVPTLKASLAICALGPSFGAWEAMGVSAFDTVLIAGLGPVGLGAVVNARYRGARVFAVEGNPWRAERARQMGAELVLPPDDPDLLAKLREATGGRGVDAGLDCAGAIPAQRLLIDVARRRGQVSYVAWSPHETPIRLTADLVVKGLTVRGIWHYNLNLYPKLMQVIQRSPVLDLLTSHVYPLDEVQTAFATLAGQETAKVILEPWAT